MFDIGWSEMLVIAVVLIVVVGPKDLPRVLRSFGRYAGQLRRMAGDFQRQVNDAIRESELDDVRRDIESVRRVHPASQMRSMLSNNGEAQPAAMEPLPAPATQGDPVKIAPQAPAAAAAKSKVKDTAKTTRKTAARTPADAASKATSKAAAKSGAKSDAKSESGPGAAAGSARSRPGKSSSKPAGKGKGDA
ncbi:MAG: Sec-independent protein translocase protein TatB [Flavobacteriaceae bacterium]